MQIRVMILGSGTETVTVDEPTVTPRMVFDKIKSYRPDFTWEGHFIAIDGTRPADALFVELRDGQIITLAPKMDQG